MKSAVHFRALLVCLVLVAGFSALSARLIYLQWINRDLSASKAASSRTEREILPGWFGNIVDRNDEIMARNLPVTTIVADKYHLRDPDVAARGVAYAKLVDTGEWIHGSDEERRRMLRRQARRLREEMPLGELLDSYIEHVIPITARALGMRARDLEEKLGEKLDYVTIVKDLREDEAAEVEETLKEYFIHGFRFEKSVKRWYTTSKSATHTIGYVNHEGVGQCGVEREFGMFLRGHDGYRITRKDQSGLVLLTGGGTLKPPRSGFDVKLTLDLSIQAIVEEELDAGLREFESSRGAVVMLDPKTGDVLAIASRPHFDLNLRENIGEAGMHFAVQAVFEPGSTLKMIATSAALDLGIMSPNSEVNCYWGYRSMGSWGVRDHHPYGMLTLEQVLSKSSNTGVFEIARRVGPKSFIKYLKGFGFMEKTGIALSGEQKGLLTDPDNPVDFSRMSYGYGVAVTPLQLACAYATIANDGVRMKPRLVQAVLANDGSVVQSYPPEEVQRVLSVSTARKMRAALATVVNVKGTGKRAIVPGFIGCGKTGTARKLWNGIYYQDRYAVTFVGFLPRDDPAFVCVVVIDDPLQPVDHIGGGTVAAPIYRRIATRTAAYMNLTPTEPIDGQEVLATTDR
ncbi:MAG: peptidoglycan D,D-transpeptidase FtsI family protein [Roseibacillus sp.]